MSSDCFYYNRSYLFEVRKKEFYRCCSLGCKTCLCKICIDQMNQDLPSYISNESNQNDNNNDDNGDNSSDCNGDGNNSGDKSYSSNPSDEEGSTVSSVYTGHDSLGDDFGDFLTSTDDADLMCGADHDFFRTMTLFQLQMLENELLRSETLPNIPRKMQFQGTLF